MSEETVSPEAGPLLALRGLTVTYRTEEGPLPDRKSTRLNSSH